MLFGSDTSSPDAGWLTTLGGLVVSVVTNVILLWREWRGAKKEGRRDTIDEYAALLERQQKTTDRHETEIEATKRIIATLSERCSECDSDMAFMYGFMKNLHGAATRLAASVTKLGGEAESIPPMPPKPKRRYPEADFLQRSMAHISDMGRAANAHTGLGEVRDRGVNEESADEGSSG